MIQIIKKQECINIHEKNGTYSISRNTIISQERYTMRVFFIKKHIVELLKLTYNDNANIIIVLKNSTGESYVLHIYGEARELFIRTGYNLFTRSEEIILSDIIYNNTLNILRYDLYNQSTEFINFYLIKSLNIKDLFDYGNRIMREKYGLI